MEMSQRRLDINPYGDQTPTQLLGREFHISNFLLAANATNYIFPFEQLLSQPTIAAALSRFPYIRADVDIRIVQTSVPTQYGTVGVSFVPYTTSTTRWTSLMQQSQSNMVLLDVSTQEGLELRLPYLSPYTARSTVDVQPSWRLAFTGISMGSATLGAPTTANIDVYASFSNVEALGFKVPVLQAFLRQNGHGRNWAMASAAAGTAYDWISDFSSRHKGVIGLAAAAVPAIGAVASLSEPPSAPTRLEVVGDLGQGSHASPLFGDRTSSSTSFSTPRDVETVSQMLGVPSLVDRDSLTSTARTSFQVDPFVPGTYCAYLSQMYKFWTGSVQICMRFVTAPSVSAKVRVTLHPTSLQPDLVGDLPSWLVSVNGTECLSFEVPYLATTPWSYTGQASLAHVTYGLVDPLSQPFDKNVDVAVEIYQKCGPDFRFAGYESVVPTLQSAVLSLFDDVSVTPSSVTHYQGAPVEIENLLSRFSSRDPDLSNLTPIPILITSQADLLSLDNFDYLSNLFCFYRGAAEVKMMFSSGQQATTRVGLTNSKVDPLGNPWKASNSIAVTDRTVWPVVEYTFPYQRLTEVDSIWEPVGTFPQTLEDPGDVTSVFVSASEGFRNHYLLPVPTFQSLVVPRHLGSDFYQGVSTLGVDGSLTITLEASFDYTKSAYFTLQGSIRNNSGTDVSGSWVSCVLGTTVPPQPTLNVNSKLTNSVLGIMASNNPPTTGGPIATPFFAESATSNLAFTGPLNLYFRGENNALAVVSWSVSVRPWKNPVFLSSPQTSLDTVGFVQTPSSFVQTIDTAATIDVYVSNTVDAIVTNTPVPVTGTVEVLAPVEQPYPFWVSSYKPT